QKSGAMRFAPGMFAAKRKLNFAAPATDARTWQILFDPARRFNEIEGVITVLVQTRRDCQNIWIEDNIGRWKLGPLRQQIVSARAAFACALEGVGLALLIACHHDGGCAISPDE